MGPALLLAMLLAPPAVEPAPEFPWRSFQQIGRDLRMDRIDLCNPQNERTRVTEIFIAQPHGFYRVWAKHHGPQWMGILYGADARPLWVWRGTWAGDALTVSEISRYDHYIHASACGVLFDPRF